MERGRGERGREEKKTVPGKSDTNTDNRCFPLLITSCDHLCSLLQLSGRVLVLSQQTCQDRDMDTFQHLKFQDLKKYEQQSNYD